MDSGLQWQEVFLQAEMKTIYNREHKPQIYNYRRDTVVVFK